MISFFIIIALLPLSVTKTTTIKFQVKEEQDPRAFVGDVSQTDYPVRLLKGGFKVRYAIQDPTQTIFTINGSTGVLRTNQVLNRENLPPSARRDVFQIQIVFSDDSAGITGVLPTEVRVMDINDNEPKFPKDFEALYISESAPLNSRFQLVPATDADIGNNSIQSYRILSGNEDGMFDLKLLMPSANVMYLYLVNVKRLDREKKDSYRLVIAALDGGTPLPRSARKTLNITILDSNDHSPEFTKFNYAGKVRENEPNGTFVVRVEATDKDIGTNGIIMYSLDPLPEYHGLFRIDERTGEVWTNAVLDYDIDSGGGRYVLSVSARDLGPDSIPSKASITVEVIDQNDNTPVIIVLPVPGVVENGRIPEDIPVGRGVASIQVNDKDSANSVNSMIDLRLTKHKHDFRIKTIFPNRNYLLEVQRPLNLSRQARYEMKLFARDRGSPPRESNYILLYRIADKNRHAPNFTKSVYKVTVVDDSKPGTNIATITAYDPDTDREGDLEYYTTSLRMGSKNISNPQRFFEYDRKTGDLKVVPKLWCSFTPSFELVIGAKDGGRVRRRGSAVVKVTVVCAKYQYNFTIKENQPKGSIVGRVVVDPPSPGKKLSFAIENSARKDFIINSSSGVIKTVKMLDRESIATHTLVVLVTDGLIDMHLTVLVHVEDENDNAPIFIGLNDNHEVSVPSTAKRGDEVITVRATDPDTGRNGQVQYSLESGNNDKTFILDKERGVLVVFDYLFEPSYELKIKATDTGDGSKAAYVTLKIIVVLPDYLRPTLGPSKVPIFDSQAGNEGRFISRTILIVVILGSIISLLVMVVIVVMIIRCYRRQGETKTHKCKPLQRDTNFRDPEISREAAIKASKQMYSQATVNMYASNEMLDHKKTKNLKMGQAQPLPLKSSFSTSPPPSSIVTSPNHRVNGPPPYADIYPPISTTRPVSECFSSGDELDSGRGDSSLPSSPYSCHTLGKPHNDNTNHYSTYKHPKRDSASYNQYHHPVVTLPNRSQSGKKKTVTIAPDAIPHASTNL